MASAPSQQEALGYIRAKVDQLLAVMGTLPLRPEELDDSTLIALDPIGIIAESFRQVIDHLNATNQRLSVATGEIRAILDTLGAAIVVLDLEDRVEDCNPQALEWFFDGCDKGRVVGRPASEVCNCADGMEDIRARADGTDHIACIYGRDLHVVATRILDEAGQHAKTVMLFADITRQKEAERHLQLYSKVFSHVGEGIMITDADKRIIEVNDAVTRITGYSRDELVASRPAILRSGLHDEAFYLALWDTVRQQGYWQGEVLDRTRDGSLIPLLENISEVRDGDGRLTHYIAVMTDISSLKETQTRLDFLAHHDALTELPNRLLFHDRLEHAIDFARRDQRGLALLFIDLDRFKNINDSLGHHIGDLLLVEAARRLHTLVRSADTLARLGGGRIRGADGDGGQPGGRHHPGGQDRVRLQAAIPCGGHRPAHRLQHRHHSVPGGWRRRGHPAQERRRGHVPGQGNGAGGPCALQCRIVRGHAPEAGTGFRPAGGGARRGL